MNTLLVLPWIITLDGNDHFRSILEWEEILTCLTMDGK
jgi:hypothetical protein